MAISKQERSFIVAFGQRLATLRKPRGLTQVQLADLLDVSQQTVTAYEIGTRRVPITTLPLLAHTLGTTIEEMIGTPAPPGKARAKPEDPAAAGAREPTPARTSARVQRSARLPARAIALTQSQPLKRTRPAVRALLLAELSASLSRIPLRSIRATLACHTSRLSAGRSPYTTYAG